MSKSESLVDELSSLFDELDEESINTLDEEKVVEMRKKMYPYGRTIEGSDKVLTFCVTDLDKKFKQRLLMTSLVGFLNRKLDEWHVPDGIPVTTVYEYAKAKANEIRPKFLSISPPFILNRATIIRICQYRHPR